MATLAKLLLLAGPLLLLLLTAIAGYAYSQIRYLSLPIPAALALLTVVLPLITGISTRGVYGLIQRSSTDEQYQLTIPLVAVIGFQLIYQTIVATLSLAHMIPPSALACGLDDRWSKLYAEESDAIRTVQDSFNCCGFRSVKDKSFPFQHHEKSTCAAIFHRSSSCLGPWQQAEQINAGLLLLVTVVVFIINVLSILSLLTHTSPSSTHSNWIQRFQRRIRGDVESPEEDHRASMRRMIEESANDEGYHDEPDDGPVESPPEASGPRVQPSPLTDNEWRDEGTRG